MGFQEAVFEDTKWLQLAEIAIQQWALVYKAMDLQLP